MPRPIGPAALSLAFALALILALALALPLTLEAAAATPDSFVPEPAGQEAIVLGEGSDYGAFEGWLAKPPGEGPFPAVVLLHGCSGSGRDTPGQVVWRGLEGHAAILRAAGYVTLITDSFQRRGLLGGCDPSAQFIEKLGTSFIKLRVKDAHLALDHLAGLPFVDPARVGLVGLSQGGWATLKAVGEKARYYGGKERRFAAGVAFYPWCGAVAKLDRPTLILIGDADDWTPAPLCQSLKQSHEGRRGAEPSLPPLDLVIYPGATHSFDLPMAKPREYLGHKLQADPQARDDARLRMLAFFARHLQPTGATR